MNADIFDDEQVRDDTNNRFQSPKIGVAGVVINDGSLLLIKRGREPAYGTWSIPGGRLEFGETLREGVEREVLEECGIEVEAGDVLGVFDMIERNDAGEITFHYVLIDIEARYVKGNAHAGSDALAVRWVLLSDVHSLPLPPRMHELVELLMERRSDS